MKFVGLDTAEARCRVIVNTRDVKVMIDTESGHVMRPRKNVFRESKFTAEGAKQLRSAATVEAGKRPTSHPREAGAWGCLDV